MSFVLGLNCKIAYSTSGSAKSATTYLTLVKDVTINLSDSEVDVTTRAANGWKEYASGLLDGSVDFDMLYDPSDAGFTAVKSAFFNRTVIYFYVTDGLSTGTGGGFDSPFYITAFNITQGLEDAVSVSITAKPTSVGDVHPTWD